MKTSVQHRMVVKKASKLLGRLKSEAEKHAGSEHWTLTAASSATTAAAASGWYTWKYRKHRKISSFTSQ